MNENLRARPGLRIGLWTGIVVVLVLYLASSFSVVPAYTSAKAEGYYALLTEGFLHGQLHLRLEPDPRLLKLANPYAGAQGIPRLHDATLFKGHYYLYFSAAPALLLFLPWTILSGNFLCDGAGTIFFAVIGILAGARLWWRMSQLYLRGLNPAWIATGILLFGIGNYNIYALQSSAVYSVPIACACAFLLLAFNAVEVALSAKSSKTQIVALGSASLIWGLAIASRPHYLLSLAGLAIAGGVICWQPDRSVRFRRWHPWKAAFWTVFPAAVIGAGLLAFNYLRYKNPFEFGMTYQLAAEDIRGLKLAGPENIIPNARDYFFTSADYSPYFPFALEEGELIGVLHWAPFALLAFAFPLTLFSPKLKAARTWVVVGVVFLVAGVATFISLCCFFGNNTRYVIDFLSPLIFCGMLVAGYSIQAVSESSRAVRIFVAALVSMVGIVTCVHAIALSFQQNPRAAWSKLFARIADSPAKFWEWPLGIRHGPVVLKLKFPATATKEQEPLVSSGFGRDLIYVQSTDSTHVVFGYFHEGTGGPKSDPVSVVPGKEYTIECDLGSLYPPREHPAFYGWDESSIDAVKRRLDVKLDGRTVLHWMSSFYPAQPFEIQFGKNHRGVASTKQFSGQVLEISRPGMPTPDQAVPLLGEGPIRLHVLFPQFVAVVGEPLISTGRPGQGDLVYVTYLGPKRLRFGHDSWSQGNVETAEVDYDPSIPHLIDVDMAPFYRNSDQPIKGPNPFKLRFDGQLLITATRQFHPSSPYDLAFGFNATGCSSAGGIFTGPLLRAERIAEIVSPPNPKKEWGPVVLTIKLPLLYPTLREPLVVTGKPGKGDLVYLAGVNDHQMRIGYDHWGISGTFGDVMEVDHANPHIIEVSMGSLYPTIDDPIWGDIRIEDRKQCLSKVVVTFDGKPALVLDASTYPSTRDEISFCENPIGGSTCSAKFTGQIYAVQSRGLTRNP